MERKEVKEDRRKKKKASKAFMSTGDVNEWCEINLGRRRRRRYERVGEA